MSCNLYAADLPFVGTIHYTPIQSNFWTGAAITNTSSIRIDIVFLYIEAGTGEVQSQESGYIEPYTTSSILLSNSEGFVNIKTSRRVPILIVSGSDIGMFSYKVEQVYQCGSCDSEWGL